MRKFFPLNYELSNIEWKLYPKQLKKEFNRFHNDSVLESSILIKQLKKYNDFELAIKTTAYQIITLEFTRYFIKELHRIKTALANHKIDDHPDKFGRYIYTNYSGLLKLHNPENTIKPRRIKFNAPRFMLKYKKLTLSQINYDLQTQFVTPLRKTFEEDYQSEILPHPYVHIISNKPPAYRQITNPGNPKLQWNNQVNVLVTIFYELANTKFFDGEPYLNATPNQITDFIFNNFTDKTGNDYSKDTIRTILKPSRVDKRAPEHKKYKFPF